MWQFANSKLKKKVGYKKLSNFLKDLGLKQRTVFNEKDETHQLRHLCFWLAESPEGSPWRSLGSPRWHLGAPAPLRWTLLWPPGALS